ncbi:MAG: diguanylate cyclase domain-containing protein [Anaerolineae bacterium]
MEIKLYLRMLQRSWWIVALTALVAVAVALVVSYSTVPTYESVSRYIVSPNPAFLSGDSNIIYSLDQLDKQTVITTYAEVMNSSRMYAETLALLKLDPASLLTYQYSAIVLPNTSIIEFTVRGTNPATVVQLNAAMGQHVVEYVGGLYKIYDMGLLDPATHPIAPVSPKPFQDSAVALVVGIALGAALALLRELLRAPIRNFLRQRRIDDMSLALKRASFEEELTSAAVTSGSPLCVGFVHLSGLVDYMDVLPQPTLENILRHVTQTLKNQLRGNDLVGRWDSADFVIMLSNTKGSAAVNTLGRVAAALSVPVRTDVTEEVMELRPVIGVTEYSAGDTEASLVDRAKSALDLARKNGGLYLSDAKSIVAA